MPLHEVLDNNNAPRNIANYVLRNNFTQPPPYTKAIKPNDNTILKK